MPGNELIAIEQNAKKTFFDDIKEKYGRIIEAIKEKLYYFSSFFRIGNILIGLVSSFFTINSIYIYYAAKRDIPYIEMMERLGGHILAISITAYFFVLIMMIIIILPSILRMLDPVIITLDKSNIEISEKRVISISRHIINSMFGAIAIFFVLYDDFASVKFGESVVNVKSVLCTYITISILTITSSVAFYCYFRKKIINEDGSSAKISDEIQFSISSNIVNFAYYSIFSLITISVISSFGLENFNGHIYAYIFVGAILIIPVLFVFIISFIVRKLEIYNVVIAMLLIFAVLISVMPGATRFIDLSLNTMLIGGDLPVTLYLKKETGCVYTSNLVHITYCETGTANKALIPLANVQLVFISNDRYFIRYPIGPASTASDRPTRILAIPKEDVGAVDYAAEK